jgi:hypothetical protein
MHNKIIENERNTYDASDIEYEQIDETPYICTNFSRAYH